MTLYIDEKKMSYTLEDEENVSDVLHAVNDQIKNFYSYIKNVTADNVPVSLDTQDPPLLNTVKELRIFTAHIHELYYAKLEFLLEIIMVCKDREGTTNKDLKLSEQDILPIASSMLTEEDTQIIMDILHNKANVPAIEALTKKIEHNLKHLEDPLEACRGFLKTLEHLLKHMETIPVKIQSGDLAPVISDVITTCELLQGIIRTYLLCTHRYFSLEAIDFSALQTRLQELQDILSDASLDTLLLSDIIEYELIPSAEKWIITIAQQLDTILPPA